MGREIRRVPEGWEHPTSRQQSVLKGGWVDAHEPLFEGSYETEARQWLDGLTQWLAGEHESQQITDEDMARLNEKYAVEIERSHKAGIEDGWTRENYAPTIRCFVKNESAMPDPKDYMPEWSDEERTHYQVYETVSEGTPVSPVFATEEELSAWLISEGYSSEAVEKFIEYGSAPSFTMVGSRLYENLEGLVI